MFRVGYLRIADEEEEFVLEDRSSDCGAEVVDNEMWLWRADGLKSEAPRVGIQRFVLMVFKGASMESVVPRLVTKSVWTELWPPPWLGGSSPLCTVNSWMFSGRRVTASPEPAPALPRLDVALMPSRLAW